MAAKCWNSDASPKDFGPCGNQRPVTFPPVERQVITREEHAMTARQFVLALATVVCVGGTGNAAPEPQKSAALPWIVSGGITAEDPTFIPIGGHGCKVILFHPGHHHLSGAIKGEIVEDGYFLIDQCTGEGFYYVTAAFTGTVLGSKPGTATFKADGRIRDSTIIDLGHFTLEGGAEGLAGVRAFGTFNFTMGVGGKYFGIAYFDRRSK
jgi:hypothetical protein